MQEICTPPHSMGGMLNKKFCQGPELDHNVRSCTKSQLSSHIPVNARWRTRHTLTDTHTDNMQFLVWPVHRTFARQSDWLYYMVLCLESSCSHRHSLILQPDMTYKYDFQSSVFLFPRPINSNSCMVYIILFDYCRILRRP